MLHWGDVHVGASAAARSMAETRPGVSGQASVEERDRLIQAGSGWNLGCYEVVNLVIRSSL